MTAAERALWQRAEREARRYRPAMQRAILAAWTAVKASLSLAQIERLLNANAIEALAALVGEATGDILGVTFTPLVRETYSGAATAQVARITGPLAGARFDLLNARSVRAALTLESTALATLVEEVRATVRQVVARGITEGANPRTVARTLRSVIGLAPNQSEAVANFRGALETIGSNKGALGYRLRDHRFDATLTRLRAEGGELTTAQVDTMVSAYQNRFVAWNAETHARTAALQAQRAGNKAAWEAALDQSGFDRTRVTKRWVATQDDRTRDEHRAADGTEIPFDEMYPFDGGVMTPGDFTFNCRCVELIRVRIGPATRGEV